MATELIPKDVFIIADNLDEQQITNLGKFKDVLCYKIRDHYELSYKGIKHISLYMANKGFPLSTIEQNAELKGDGKEKTWYATVRVLNKTTNQDAVGNSECPFYDGPNQDHFARTKALSKAERNAMRKLIPEALIVDLVNKATTKGEVAEIKPQDDSCKCQNPRPGLSSGICVTCNKKVAR